MHRTTTITERLEWELPGSGKFTAELENGKITQLQMCEDGTPQNCLTSTDHKHLRNIVKALTDLLKIIDKEHEPTTEPSPDHPRQG